MPTGKDSMDRASSLRFIQFIKSRPQNERYQAAIEASRPLNRKLEKGLRANAEAPDHTLTLEEICHAAGWDFKSGKGVASSPYGQFAKKIVSKIGVTQTTFVKLERLESKDSNNFTRRTWTAPIEKWAWTYGLAALSKNIFGEMQWTLYPEFVTALVDLGLANDSVHPPGKVLPSVVLNELGFSLVKPPGSDGKTQSSPDWVRDEMIVLLDFYLLHRRRIPDKGSTEIESLSETLNLLPIHPAAARGVKFRNSNSVYLRLMNFMAIDPEYPGMGMQNTGRLARVIWNEFAEDPRRCHDIAVSILASLKTHDEIESNSDPDMLGVVEAPEGRVLTRTHVYRERNRKMVDQKKREALRSTGSLHCAVCTFEFRENYGEQGSGFIECHHTKPLSEYGSGGTTRLEDLVLLCANCHRMIHAQSQWLTIDELKAIWMKNHTQSK